MSGPASAESPTGFPTAQREAIASDLTIDEIPGELVDDHTADPTLDDIRKSARTAPSDEPHTRRDAPDGELDAKIRAHLGTPDRKKPDALIGTLVGGRFQVLRKIGAGGMGAVYRARQEGMDRDVAIKVLLGEMAENDTILRRFTLEALAVSRLRHPHTIQIFDFGQTPLGQPYIAMELLEGQTVHELLRAERPLPIRRALRIIAQVAESLAEAHSKGIVHRDLKPENVFLVTVGDDPDYCKVLDFGVAKLRDADSDGKGTLTQAGSIFGTPRYMSPEQCAAQPVDARSDIYTMGVILYEMITGRAPFIHDQALSLLLAHVNDAPTPPSVATDKQVIPEEVEHLVLRLLAKNADDRVQHATELAHQCHQIEAALPTAFDTCVGSEEAATLGVKLAQSTTLHFPTARTLRVPNGEMAPTLLGPELVMPSVPRDQRRLVAPLLGVGIIGVVALLYAMLSSQRSTEPLIVEKQVIVERTVQLPADMVEITISTVPAGAFVIHQGLNIATTNARLQHKKDAPPEIWELKRDGFATAQVQVAFGDSRALEVKLIKLAGAPAPTPAPVPVAETKPALRPRPRAEPRLGEPAARQEPVPVEAKLEPPRPKLEPPKPKDDSVDELQ